MIATHTNQNQVIERAFEAASRAYLDSIASGGALNHIAVDASPDMGKVAQLLDVLVLVVDFPDDLVDVANGLMLPFVENPKDQNGYIYLNKNLSAEKQVQALSHEFGHAVMDCHAARGSHLLAPGDAMMQIREDLPARLTTEERIHFEQMRTTEAELRADAFGRILLLPLKTMRACATARSEWSDAEIARAIRVTPEFVALRWNDPDCRNLLRA